MNLLVGQALDCAAVEVFVGETGRPQAGNPPAVVRGGGHLSARGR